MSTEQQNPAVETESQAPDTSADQAPDTTVKTEPAKSEPTPKFDPEAYENSPEFRARLSAYTERQRREAIEEYRRRADAEKQADTKKPAAKPLGERLTNLRKVNPQVADELASVLEEQLASVRTEAEAAAEARIMQKLGVTQRDLQQLKAERALERTRSKAKNEYGVEYDELAPFISEVGQLTSSDDVLGSELELMTLAAIGKRAIAEQRKRADAEKAGRAKAESANVLDAKALDRRSVNAPSEDEQYNPEKHGPSETRFRAKQDLRLIFGKSKTA